MMTLPGLVALWLLVRAAGYPSLVECSTTVKAGQTWMGAAAVGSSDRTASFTKDGDAVACGSTYEAGAAYAATLSSTSGQFLFDLAGGAFDDGGACSGARAESHGAALTAPADGSDMVLVAAWATGYGAVSVSAACTLVAPAPSAAPSTAAPSYAPTTAPSYAPCGGGRSGSGP